MTIQAVLIKASQDRTAYGPNAPVIWTLLLRYPRFIHAEFMTHRVFSRNASSSRAIPVLKLIEDVQRDPAMPIYWGQNQPGMQAKAEMTSMTKGIAQVTWDSAMEEAISSALRLADLGAHKQIVNRILEPFSHINVLVTATEWDNFLVLRDHEDAQPEMQVLAQKIKQVLDTYEPPDRSLHLPFVVAEEENQYPSYELRLLSAARCARTSYLTHEGKAPEYKADLALANKLLASPIHASPFEHAATSGSYPNVMYYNLRGWQSSRWSMDKLEQL